MAYDDANDRVILFGGSGEKGMLGDTWLLAGLAWKPGAERPAALSPREGHAMAYDVGRQRVVLFGGDDGSGGTNDTWELTQDRWQPGPAAPERLTPRWEHAMAYDSAAGKIVLFGGDDGSYRNDTWLYDGKVWQPGPAAQPEGRYKHAVCMKATGGMFLFGGFGQALQREGDAWTLAVTSAGYSWARAAE